MMDSNFASQSPDTLDAKPSFRKPASDAVNRRYRRHSPASGSASPSSSGSPTRGRGQSPIYSRDMKDGDDRRKRKDDGISDKDYGRNHSSKLSSSYRSSGRNSYESSHADRRYDEYGRSHRRIDEDRDYERSSSRYGKDSKGSSRGDYTRYDGDRDRSKFDRHWGDRFSRDKITDDGGITGRNSDRGDHRRDVDYSRSRQRSMMDRDKSGDRDRHQDRNGREEDRTDNKRSSRDDRNGHSSSREIHREHKRIRDGDEDLLKEAGRGSKMELGGQKEGRVSRRKMDDVKEHFNSEEHLQGASKTSRYRDREEKISRSHERDVYMDEHNSFEKKVKLSQSEKAIGDAADDLEPSRSSTYGTEDKPSPSSKQLENPPPKGILGPPSSSASMAEATNDLNAAKVAAMKAAELVNKNLVGVGYLSTEQKKKLLWGSKKNSTVEESGNRWDMALFSDKERQEKFNKLMSLSLPWCIWPIVGCEGRGKAGPSRGELRWCGQCSSCREAERTPTRSREAIHCRPEAERWQNCGPWSVITSYPFHTVRNIWHNLVCISSFWRQSCLLSLHFGSWFLAKWMMSFGPLLAFRTTHVGNGFIFLFACSMIKRDQGKVLVITAKLAWFYALGQKLKTVASDG